ncbi:MAG: alpha-amylase family glycosyl hydrolase [Bacteroidales bacterium]|nr:alpha-amylase family glycosyl hydrolase [Bacteroidales bacterium]
MKKNIIITIVICVIVLVGVALLGFCRAKHPAAAETRHPAFAYYGTIYELNTRQFTPEGTFRAAEAHLPELKDLGVEIIWFMPIQEIGVEGRKGTLGSYYAIKDYCSFNHEFGTREDFVSFVNRAHELGMKVILDWVANHTAPDSEWTKREGWHYRDSLGNLMVQYDWTDIAKLNYENEDMRKEMLKAMHFWMDEIGIDGFRCDVAGEVPTDFWEMAMADLRLTHPDMFTLAENNDKAQELTASAFNMYYGWDLQNTMRKLAKGEISVDDLWSFFEQQDTLIRKEAIRMNFTSNHDENSWNGTEFEWFGEDGAATYAAFTYVIPGMPLIYTGQEYGNHKRLEFFEKDGFERKHAEQFEMYKNLNAMRRDNPALWSPELGAPMTRIANDNPAIFSCARVLEDNVVLGIFNFSAEPQTVTLQTAGLEGDYTCICGMPVMVGTEDQITLRPFEWLIYAK